MNKASQMFRTRHVKPLESALWWIDYVLKNDAETLSAMKPLGIHQSWYTRRLLDVWLALFSLAVGSIVILVLIVYLMYFENKRGALIENKRVVKRD